MFYTYEQVPVDGQYHRDKYWGVGKIVVIEAPSLVIANGIARECGIETGTLRWPTVDVASNEPLLVEGGFMHYINGRRESR